MDWCTRHARLVARPGQAPPPAARRSRLRRPRLARPHFAQLATPPTRPPGPYRLRHYVPVAPHSRLTHLRAPRRATPTCAPRPTRPSRARPSPTRARSPTLSPPSSSTRATRPSAPRPPPSTASTPSSRTASSAPRPPCRPPLSLSQMADLVPACHAGPQTDSLLKATRAGSYRPCASTPAASSTSPSPCVPLSPSLSRSSSCAPPDLSLRPTGRKSNGRRQAHPRRRGGAHARAAHGRRCQRPVRPRLPSLLPSLSPLAHPCHSLHLSRPPRSSPDSPSKRDALFFLANSTFRVYFALSNLRLCDTVLNNTQNAALARLETVPKGDRCAFLYYRGRIALYQRRLPQARNDLRRAFALCSAASWRNGRCVAPFLSIW